MDITDDVVQAFREECSGFDDSTIWKSGTVERALKKADRETGGECWGMYGEGTVKQEGMFAFASHHLMIKRGVNMSVKNGGIASAVGAVTSKSVGDESVSFAVATPGSLSETGESLLASTTPGQEFIRLRNQVVTGVTV
ncbi:virion structural protein [Vibrio phage D81]